MKNAEKAADAEKPAMSLRTYLLVALAALILLSAIYFGPGLLSPGGFGAPGATPEGSVRAVVGLLRAGVSAPSAYERYFTDAAVAKAIADSVKSGGFPRALDVESLSAEAGGDDATVTVKWNVRRPNVKENGTAFLLRKAGGTWRISDAKAKQVGK